MRTTKDLAYKAIRINHIDNTISILGEYEYTEQGKEDASMALYFDKYDESSTDEDFVYTWQVNTIYRFYTNLPYLVETEEEKYNGHN